MRFEVCDNCMLWVCTVVTILPPSTNFGCSYGDVWRNWRFQHSPRTIEWVATILGHPLENTFWRFSYYKKFDKIFLFARWQHFVRSMWRIYRKAAHNRVSCNDISNPTRSYYYGSGGYAQFYMGGWNRGKPPNPYLEVVHHQQLVLYRRKGFMKPNKQDSEKKTFQ